jgi:uncharacterized protein (TIGR02594 family)
MEINQRSRMRRHNLLNLLEEMRSSLGVQEIKGKAKNEAIMAYFREVGHPEIEQDDTTAWCAARVGSALKRCGHTIPPKDVNLLARSYCTYGVACEPQPGAIGVVPRGNSSWMGHVFVIEEILPDGRWQTIGGNQGKEGYGKVSRAVVDPKTTTILAVRKPVAATVPDLRKAGSTEIKKADRVQNAGSLLTFLAAIVAAVKELFGPVDVPKFADLKEGLDWWQMILGGANAVGKLLLDNPWLGGTLLVGGVLVLVGRQIKAARVAKHEAGVPLSAEVAKLQVA